MALSWYVVCDGWCTPAKTEEAANIAKDSLDAAQSACPRGHEVIEAEDRPAARKIYDQRRNDAHQSPDR